MSVPYRKLLIILFSLFLSACSQLGSKKPAALQITTSPEASVFIDDKHVGKTPFYSDQLKAGMVTLKITASSASYIEKVDLHPGTLTVVNRKLADNFQKQSGEILWLEKGKQNLLIVSTPKGSSVTVDGIYKGETPLLTSDLKEGDHKVLVSKKGYENHEFVIKILSKYDLSAQVTLSTSSQIKTSQELAEIESQQAEKIEVLRTPQGFLRVRKEPSLSSPEVGRVADGQTLEVVQKTEDWVKIIFEGKQGWISKQYTKEI